MKDILIDIEEGDLAHANGDLVIGNSSVQNQKHLMMGGVNDWKQWPTDMVDFPNLLLDEASLGELRADITRKFEADGMKTVKLTGKTFETLKVYASY